VLGQLATAHPDAFVHWQQGIYPRGSLMGAG